MRSAVNTRPPGRFASHESATSSVVKSAPARSSSSRAIRGKLRSSSSGMPSMFSTRLVGRLRRFHGYRAATAGSSPCSVKYEETGQLPVDWAMARMPSREIFSTGLPSRQPAALPSQAPSIRSPNEPVDIEPGPPASLDTDGSSGGCGARSRMASRASGSAATSPAGRGSSSMRASRARASARSSGGAGCGDAPLTAAVGEPPAATHSASGADTSTPSRRAAASACGTRSSGWVQLNRSIRVLA